VDTIQCQLNDDRAGKHDLQSPIFSLVKGKCETKYGREEMSMTARARDYGVNVGFMYVTRALAYLVQGSICVAVSLDPPPFAKSGFKSLAKRKSSVLRRVVIVNVQITLAFESQGESSMLSHGSIHLNSRLISSLRVNYGSGTDVVEEANASRNTDHLLFDSRLIVETNSAGNAGLTGLTGYSSGSV
jgi:hypothetical protein